MLYLHSNILTCICALMIGPMSDTFPIHKIMTFVNILVLASFLPAWLDISQFDQDATHHLGWYFDIGFILTMAFSVCSFMLSLTMIAKLCNEKTRGTMFCLNALVGSLAILVFQWASGYLYDNVSHQIPFLIGFASFVVFTISCIVLGLMGKIAV